MSSVAEIRLTAKNEMNNAISEVMAKFNVTNIDSSEKYALSVEPNYINDFFEKT